MSETNKEAIESDGENDSENDNTNSTSAFHEHVWWIAIVIGVIVVVAIARRVGGV